MIASLGLLPCREHVDSKSTRRAFLWLWGSSSCPALLQVSHEVQEAAVVPVHCTYYQYILHCSLYQGPASIAMLFSQFAVVMGSTQLGRD